MYRAYKRTRLASYVRYTYFKVAVSFPEGDISKEFSREIALPNIFKPQNFRFVNRETAKIVSGLNRGQLEILLRGHNLSKKAFYYCIDTR